MSDESGDPDQDAASLWHSFHASGDAATREHLIEHYARVARGIAATVYRTRTDDTVAFEDYLQYARVGLIEAIDRFDTLRGTSFEVFSSYRIRGAIINGLTRETELRARRSRWARRLAERERSIGESTLSDPSRASLEDFVSLSVGLAVGLLIDEEPAEQADESPGANPYAEVEANQLRSRVRELIEQLPAREQEVMRGHYYKQLEFQSIAEAMGVSKGRVSQLHARAVERIREWLCGSPRIDRNM